MSVKRSQNDERKLKKKKKKKKKKFARKGIFRSVFL